MKRVPTERRTQRGRTTTTRVLPSTSACAALLRRRHDPNRLDVLNALRNSSHGNVTRLELNWIDFHAPPRTGAQCSMCSVDGSDKDEDGDKDGRDDRDAATSGTAAMRPCRSASTSGVDGALTRSVFLCCNVHQLCCSEWHESLYSLP